MQQEQGFNTTVPLAADQLQIRRNMNTGALSTSFPFTSADLVAQRGHSLRHQQAQQRPGALRPFQLENGNTVVFAKSGAGKCFTVKLEALRSMMFGTEMFIIDPENEYQHVRSRRWRLCAPESGICTRINPFDLPHVLDSEEADNALRANLITLHGLLRLMMGGAT